MVLEYNGTGKVGIQLPDQHSPTNSQTNIQVLLPIQSMGLLAPAASNAGINAATAQPPYTMTPRAAGSAWLTSKE